MHHFGGSHVRPSVHKHMHGKQRTPLFNVDTELDNFWQKQADLIAQTDLSQFRESHHTPELPLARIKKIMRIDDEVKQQMISAEAPILFSKAAEIFIEELTLKSWVYTEENRRKTLQKNDIAMAVSKDDQFDFLIDIVPRDETKLVRRAVNAPVNMSNLPKVSLSSGQQTFTLPSDNVQYFIPAGQQTLNGQVVQMAPIQLMAAAQQEPQGSVLPVHVSSEQSGDIMDADREDADQLPQVYQQVVLQDGTVQHVPLQLSTEQLLQLKAQFEQHPSNSSQASGSRSSISGGAQRPSAGAGAGTVRRTEGDANVVFIPATQ